MIIMKWMDFFREEDAVENVVEETVSDELEQKRSENIYIILEAFTTVYKLRFAKLGRDPDSIRLDERLEDITGGDLIQTSHMMLDIHDALNIKLKYKPGEEYERFPLVRDVINYFASNFDFDTNIKHPERLEERLEEEPKKKVKDFDAMTDEEYNEYMKTLEDYQLLVAYTAAEIFEQYFGIQKDEVDFKADLRTITNNDEEKTAHFILELHEEFLIPVSDAELLPYRLFKNLFQIVLFLAAEMTDTKLGYVSTLEEAEEFIKEYREKKKNNRT